MSETVEYSLLARQDIRIGRETFTVQLADGSTVILDELNLDHFDGLYILTDAVTTDISRVFLLRHATTGTAAAGFGAMLVLQGEDSAGSVSDIAAFCGVFDDATAGSEDSSAYIFTRKAGATLSKAFCFRNTGNFIATLSAALTADRTITLPDSDQTLVGRTTTDTLTNKTLTDPVVNAGTGSETFYPTGPIVIDLGNVGTAANTTETTLKTYSLPANTLSSNDMYVDIEAWGSTASNANTKTIRLYFGGTTLGANNITTAPNGLGWMYRARVYRTGAATQIAVGNYHVGPNNNDVITASPTETLSGAVVIKCTGTNGTASANDIVCHGMRVTWGRE